MNHLFTHFLIQILNCYHKSIVLKRWTINYNQKKILEIRIVLINSVLT